MFSCPCHCRIGTYCSSLLFVVSDGCDPSDASTDSSLLFHSHLVPISSCCLSFVCYLVCFYIHFYLSGVIVSSVRLFITIPSLYHSWSCVNCTYRITSWCQFTSIHTIHHFYM